MKKLGEILRLLRLQRSWSQEDVAHELDMSLAGYAKIERNLTDITLSRLRQIARLYGIAASDLLALCERSNRIHQQQKLIEEKDQEIMRLQQKVIELIERKK
ncbi:MAG: helix-turn-helix domain-containing protein [Cytophagaceae bacterium]|nr:helix-turn-helix domain-containing protein [Cytophagaceae bacterium]